MNTNANNTLYRTTAALLIFEAILLFVPVIVLGGAINWPASLDEPASVNLPLILEQRDAVIFGYFVYLIYSVLILPAAVMTARVIGQAHPQNTALQLASGFGIASAVLRVLGIIRWLFPMMTLAEAYTNPALSEATRESVAIMYQMLNDYAGSIGEVLGVGFFGALWVLAASIGIWQTRRLPRWFALYGVVVALGLASGLLEVWRIDLGALITVTVSLLQLWLLIFGVLLLIPRLQPQS
ncbi:MAG: DUF4386 domain-containing protein [Phototrophicaceae bacterium]